MRRTLYRKLILIYVILAIAGFTLISTVGSRMVEDSLVSSASTQSVPGGHADRFQTGRPLLPQ